MTSAAKTTSRTRGGEGGMTLLEIMVALAVVGLLMLVGYTGLRNARKSDLREDTMMVAAALRTAYNSATQTGLHHRVVFDLDAQTFHIEVCEGEVKLRRTEVEELAAAEEPIRPQLAQTSEQIPELLDASSPEEATKIAAALSGSRVGTARCQPRAAEAGDDEDASGGRHPIRQELGVRIARVHVQHLEDPAEEGMATINFFPLGYAEKAIVEVVHESEAQYTLLVHGMTGRVELVTGELEDPNDHMMRDGAGEEVAPR